MRHISCVVLLVTLAACGTESSVTRPNEALSQQQRFPIYRIVKLSETLGGTSNRGSVINERGWIAGSSNLTDNGSRHAVLWRHKTLIDLKTLGGPNSNVQWHGLNNRGMVVGIAETNRPNPLNEDWSCSAFFPSVTKLICRGFYWEEGERMQPLPGLGGPNSYAAGVNDHGQIVGWAETRVHDPTCRETQVLQFRAVLWEPRRNRTTELRPYPGDSTSAATAINNQGQAVGISGECDVAVGRFSARHAVLWENGKVKKLGDLGGTSWHTPTDISERGDVIGFSNPDLPGDREGEFLALAFLWTKSGGIRSLGTLRGDTTSQANGINARRQVVGVSTSLAGVSRAFLWQDGVMKSLNDLAPGLRDSLVTAQDINEDGEITGRLFERSSGRTLPFIAIPVDR
jgi:probable HAF family extracellular repeat protein